MLKKNNEERRGLRRKHVIREKKNVDILVPLPIQRQCVFHISSMPHEFHLYETTVTYKRPKVIKKTSFSLSQENHFDKNIFKSRKTFPISYEGLIRTRYGFSLVPVHGRRVQL